MSNSVEPAAQVGVDSPKLIKAQGGQAVSFTYNVVPTRPLFLLAGPEIWSEGRKHRIWIDAQGRSFAVLDGMDPNEVAGD
jgi:hypothetical protein